MSACLAALRRLLAGRSFTRAVERHARAAEDLDRALREVLSR